MKRQLLVLVGIMVLAAFVAMPAYGQAQTGQYGAAADEPSVTLDQQAGGQAGQAALQASKIMGADVKGQQGDSVGKVGDLILSDQGNVEYLVLARGGILGIGGEMVPVPWDNVNAESADNITLSLDEERLKNAPSFSSGDWQQMAPADFEQQVRGYYGGGEGQQPANQPMKQPGMEQQGDQGYGGQQTR